MFWVNVYETICGRQWCSRPHDSRAEADGMLLRGAFLSRPVYRLRVTPKTA